MTTTESRPSGGLLQTLRHSPVTHELANQARNMLSAQTDRATGSISQRLSSVTDKLGEVGETGKLPPVADGAKRMLQGDSPVKATMGAASSGVADKVKGAFQKLTGKGKGTGKGKSMDIEESIDIGVPVSTAYNQWTQYQDFSRFMKGVESVEQSSETETNWRAKVFKSRRTWKATIQEQIPDQRIVWTSEGAKGSTKGVVTFHPLGENLTRVLLTLEYYPSGVVEKTGNLWRAAGRRARLDLKNFRRFIAMEGEPTGSWRGEIHDGEVTVSHEENEQNEDQDDSAQDSQDEESQDEESQDDEAEDEESSEEEDERPARVQRAERPRKRQPGPRPDQSGRERRGSSDVRKAPAKKAPAKKAPAKKVAAKKAPAKKAAAKKAPAKKAGGRLRRGR